MTPYEDGSALDGDMDLTQEQMDLFLGKKVGYRHEKYRWPNNTVVFDFDDSVDENSIRIFLNSTRFLNNILAGCISFERRQGNDERNYTTVKYGEGCSSAVGYTRRPQSITLGEGCYDLDTIVHECFHTVGLFHMQSAYNRDDYVKIHWGNIAKEKWHNFYKEPNTIAVLFDVPYDYNSIMHYGAFAFTKNGQRTMEPTRDDVVFGEEITALDIRRIRRMYNCD